MMQEFLCNVMLQVCLGVASSGIVLFVEGSGGLSVPGACNGSRGVCGGARLGGGVNFCF